MSDKDIKKLVRELQKAGFTVDQSKTNYYQVRTADGRFVVTISSTPSSPRTIRRIRSTLRKHGFEG